jgi:Fe-S-cluster containining protein
MACFYENGLQFTCTRCSDCCRKKPGFVYLSRTDLTNLCICFKLNDKEFIEKYCRWVHYYDNNEVLCLLEKSNYDCILWHNGCTAYENRPIQCSTYPFWTSLLDFEQDWNKRSRDCPGINCGQMHDKKEIEQQLSLYENNEPLKLRDYKSEEIVIGEEK